MFYRQPVGRNIIKVCTSISCYLCGSDAALARLERELGVKRGETSADGNITLIAAECLAACGDAPVAQLNDEFVGRLTEEKVAGLVGQLKGQ
jgi:NADH-quinone oxidoreductase subunit E